MRLRGLFCVVCVVCGLLFVLKKRRKWQKMPCDEKSNERDGKNRQVGFSDSLGAGLPCRYTATWSQAQGQGGRNMHAQGTAHQKQKLHAPNGALISCLLFWAVQEKRVPRVGRARSQMRTVHLTVIQTPLATKFGKNRFPALQPAAKTPTAVFKIGDPSWATMKRSFNITYYYCPSHLPLSPWPVATCPAMGAIMRRR